MTCFRYFPVSEASYRSTASNEKRAGLPNSLNVSLRARRQLTSKRLSRHKRLTPREARVPSIYSTIRSPLS